MARIGSATPAPPILDLIEDYSINLTNIGCGLTLLGCSVQIPAALTVNGLWPTGSGSLEFLVNGVPAWRFVSTVAGIGRSGQLQYNIPLHLDLGAAPIVPGTTALSRLYTWDTVFWREVTTTGQVQVGIITSNSPGSAGLTAGPFNSGYSLRSDPAVVGGRLQVIRKLTNAAAPPVVVVADTGILPTTPRKYTWAYRTTSAGKRLEIGAEGFGNIFTTDNPADFPAAAAGIPSQGINLFGISATISGVIGDVLRVTGQRLRIENLT